MKTKIRFAVAAFLALLFAGCVGYNNTLFMTKSNVGLDFDSKPPTLEVSIARREGVIAPTFEGGQTPPVLASFAIEPGAHVPLFPRISQTFAGGDAGVTMSSLYGASESPAYNPATYDSALWLVEEPHPKILGIRVKTAKPGTVHPFIFGTDTSFGLKVAWSGLTAQFPDTVRLALNRKEFALAPVFISQDETHTGAINKVKMPSFLATMDNSTDIGTPQETSVHHVQYFATGRSADEMALHPEVRQAMIQRLDPKATEKAEEFKAAQAKVADEYKDVAKILSFVKSADGKVNKENLTKLTPNTGLGQRWIDKYSAGTLAELESALKGKYRSSVTKLAENIQ